MKTCIFGGTFDPPHIGHLLIAQTIIESENFDRLIFLPAYLSPIKQGRKMSAPEKRLKMLDMALINNDNFEISDFEIKKGNISYTIDSIKHFKDELNIEKIVKNNYIFLKS